MRSTLRKATFIGVVIGGVLGFGPTPADAQVFLGGGGTSLSIGVGSGYGGFGYPGLAATGYGLGYPGLGGYGYPGLGSYSYSRGYAGYGSPGLGYGGYGYAPPVSTYYGLGGHDAVPHWHNTQTPVGSVNWYGLGQHDFVPHGHVQTPYSYTGYSSSPFSRTQSFYSPYPPVYRPW